MTENITVLCSVFKVDGLAALTSAGTMELQTKLNSLEKENKTLKKGKEPFHYIIL